MDFHLDGRVRFHHTDAMGVVHHAAYLCFLEDARVEYLRAIGRPYDRIREADGVDIAVVGVNVIYHAPLRFDEEFRTHAALAAAGRSWFTVAYRVERGATRVLTGMTRHVMLERTSGRPVRLPDWVADEIRAGAGRVGATPPGRRP